MKTIKENRIYSFDLLKLISIFFVFIHHILMDMYVVHPMHNLKLIETLTIRPNMNFAMVACGVFVFISGATIAFNKRDESLEDFYKKRLKRLLIPFYIAYMIYFIIKIITYKTIFIFPDVPKWRFIFTVFGIDEYVSANGIRTFTLGIGEWFLGCIIFCYIIFPLLYEANKKNKTLTFILMTIYFLIFNFNYSKFNFIIPGHMNFLSQIYNFYLGIFFINKNVISKIKKWLLVITIPVIIFFYNYSALFMVPDNIKTTIVVISLFVTFYLSENLISKQILLKKILNAFNGLSFEIFLVHHFIIYQIDLMLNYRRVNGVETLAIFGIDVLLTIGVSILVKRLSRKAYALMKKSSN